MKRVLHIVDNIKIDSGVSSIIMNLYRNIDRKSVQFDFLVCTKTENNYENEITSLGGRFFYVGNPLSVKTVVAANIAIQSFFKEHAGEYDVAHLHSPTIALFTLRYAKSNGMKNRIVHSHSTMLSPNLLKTVINNYLIKKIPCYANNYWACSIEAAKFLYGNLICSNQQIELIKNAVDVEKFAYRMEIAEDLMCRFDLKDKIVVSHISNFSPIKNHVFLVEVIKKVVNVRKNVRFVFVGDGPTKSNFVNQIESNGLSNYCIFTGRIENVQDYLMISDAVILPSLKEGLPVTIVESQASGVPCVISDTITREVNTGMVTYIPLVEKEWENSIQKIEKLSKEKRFENQGVFLKSPFNIVHEAKRVEKLYLDME